MSDATPDHPPAPDSIWAPWRLKYLESFAEETGSSPEGAAASAATPKDEREHVSFLAAYWNDPASDEHNHVIVRTEDGMIMLNKYPYANGHLLVALGDARPRLLDYTPEQRGRLWELVDVATDLMERTLSPQGVNIGINQGRAAGAGIPQHLHAHLVPRWEGDVNFISVVGQIRVIPGALDDMAARYRKAWAARRS